MMMMMESALERNKNEARLLARMNAVNSFVNSGQTETVSVRFQPKISASFSFGISVFSLFGVSAETACFGRITLFRPILAAHFSIKSTAKTAFYGQNKVFRPKM